MKDAPISRVQKIVIAEDGPYIVSGSVPLAVQVITPNEEGLSWDWVKGKSFPSAATYKLCRLRPSASTVKKRQAGFPSPGSPRRMTGRP